MRESSCGEGMAAMRRSRGMPKAEVEVSAMVEELSSCERGERGGDVGYLHFLRVNVSVSECLLGDSDDV